MNNQVPPAVHAILPAAGRSSRMGRQKLLLPWGSSTVVEALLNDLLGTSVTSVSILVVAGDKDLLECIERFRNQLSADQAQRCEMVTVPSAPDEMKQSVQRLLTHVAARHAPPSAAGWMLVPADSVPCGPFVMEALLRAWIESPVGILVPTHAGHRGHPTLFSWSLVDKLASIPEGMGLNWLLRQSRIPVREIPLEDPRLVADLDTPRDYAAWKPVE